MRRIQFSSRIVVLVFLGAVPSLFAQITTRVSVDSNGAEANHDSNYWWSDLAVSADGRYVAFSSMASNFVPGDTNGAEDPFVHDRWTGVTVRVTDSGTQFPWGAWVVSMTPDGRFLSLVESTPYDLFVWFHDRDPDGNGVFEGNGVASLVDSDADHPDVSDDGRFICYQREASGNGQVIVFDRLTGDRKQVSVSSSGEPANERSGLRGTRISQDGRYVGFMSVATNLVEPDTNGSICDLYVHDRQLGTTERLNVGPTGEQADEKAWLFDMSSDGQRFVFLTLATNLGGGTPGSWDVFLRDRIGAATYCMSVSSSGEAANGHSFNASISPDGTLVGLSSKGTNLDGFDANGTITDLYVRDWAAGTTRRVHHSSLGEQGDRGSSESAFSADNQTIAFASEAHNLVLNDTNLHRDIFVTSSCPPAYTHLYGEGWPGTSGIPTYSFLGTPSPGATLQGVVDTGQSVSRSALLLVGLIPAERPTPMGGSLLLEPLFSLPITLGPGVSQFAMTLPASTVWCGRSAYSQVVIPDPGASHGFSFTRGLRISIGL